MKVVLFLTVLGLQYTFDWLSQLECQLSVISRDRQNYDKFLLVYMLSDNVNMISSALLHDYIFRES